MRTTTPIVCAKSPRPGGASIAVFTLDGKCYCACCGKIVSRKVLGK